MKTKALRAPLLLGIYGLSFFTFQAIIKSAIAWSSIGSASILSIHTATFKIRNPLVPILTSVPNNLF